MIEGFEKETGYLTADEIALIPVFVRCLSKKIGKKSAVSGKIIQDGMKKHGIEVPAARIRKLINHIRRNHLVNNLCASSAGYYVASNEKELENYLKGLRERIEAIQEVLKSFKNRK